MIKVHFVINSLLIGFASAEVHAQTTPSEPSKHEQACAAVGAAVQGKALEMQKSILANTSNMSAMDASSDAWKAADAVNVTQKRMFKNLSNVALEVNKRFGDANTASEKEFVGRLAGLALMQVVDLAGKCMNSSVKPADGSSTP